MINDSNDYNNTFLKNSVQSRVDSLSFQIKKKSYSLYLLKENMALHQTLWGENAFYVSAFQLQERNRETNPKQQNNARRHNHNIHCHRCIPYLQRPCHYCNTIFKLRMQQYAALLTSCKVLPKMTNEEIETRLFCNFCRTLMPCKSVNTMLQPSPIVEVK